MSTEEQRNMTGLSPEPQEYMSPEQRQRREVRRRQMKEQVNLTKRRLDDLPRLLDRLKR